MALIIILPTNWEKAMKNKTLDEKWLVVKDFYERYYGIKFKTRLDDKEILGLWDKMWKVSGELKTWYETPRPEKKVY